MSTCFNFRLLFRISSIKLALLAPVLTRLFPGLDNGGGGPRRGGGGGGGGKLLSALFLH